MSLLQSSKYSSKRDYERESSRSSANYLRSERDLSPVASGTLNGSYRTTDSPDLDSPRDSRDRSDRYQSSSYSLQKIKEIKDRGRNDYKKDRYLDKRDRRDRDVEHRTNHDRIDVSSSSRRSSKIGECACRAETMAERDFGLRFRGVSVTFAANDGPGEKSKPFILLRDRP